MNCFICNKEAHFKYTLKGYTLLQCTSCFHQWIQEKDSVDTDDFYDENYFKGKKASFAASFRDWDPEKKLHVNKTTYDIFNFWGKHGLSDKHILEIGPGPQENLFRYLSAFTSIECFDKAPIVNDFLEKRGAKTYRKWDDIPTERYDIAVAYEVIEHDPNVVQFCNNVFSKLKKGGVLLLTTGNSRSCYARIKRYKWYYYDPPAHLNYFSDTSMVTLLKKTGFDKIEITRIGRTSKKILSGSKLALIFLPLFTLISSIITVYGYKSK
jgi:hypothetical protein